MNNVTFEKLFQIILSELKPKLESHLGLSIFARERAKFEGWLKVELCESLFKYFDDVVPEKNTIDVTFKDWSIELKPINTSYRYPNVKNKTKGITNNTQEVINDINKLNNLDLKNKAVLFVVFPVVHTHIKWQVQLERIASKLKDLKYFSFKFEGNIPGVVYFGLI